MSLSRKCLAEFCDYDMFDCTKSGHTWKLWADGHVTAEYNSRWQGSRTGKRYSSGPNYVDFEMWQGCTSEEILKQTVEYIDELTIREEFFVTDKGYVVQ